MGKTKELFEQLGEALENELEAIRQTSAQGSHSGPTRQDYATSYHKAQETIRGQREAVKAFLTEAARFGFMNRLNGEPFSKNEEALAAALDELWEAFDFVNFDKPTTDGK